MLIRKSESATTLAAAVFHRRDLTIDDRALFGEVIGLFRRGPFDLGNLFRLFGETESRALTIDLGVQLPKLQVGRLYFLSPNVLH